MKVFITTSGTGSRLYDLTKYTNKSMIKIGKKPVISYIIDEYPEDTQFVISLGYHGDHVRQFLELAYPNKNFEFIYVDKYEGPGSSQVYSQLQAENYLQEPFIYHDCDTLIENLQQQIPMKFDYNFMVGYETNAELYDAFDYDVQNMNIIKTHQKPDSLNGMLAFVGICGIYDYKEFWSKLHEAYEKETTPYDFLVYHKYGLFNDNLKAIKADNWIDTGNIAGVKTARKICKDPFNILDKNDQAIFIVNGKVIKFFAKDGVVDDLLKHYKRIENFCQPIKEHTKNFITYDFIDAENAIDRMNPVRFKKMLEFFSTNGLWDPDEDALKINMAYFRSVAYHFYITKNIDRVKQFKEQYNIKDDKDIWVNDIKIPKKWTAERLIELVASTAEFRLISPSSWHGDFVLDNILYDKNNDKYILLDWRPNFISISEYGDKFYDFGKMLHNIGFNFSSCYNELYNIIEDDEQHIYLSILGNTNVYECKEVLKEFVKNIKPSVRWEFIEIICGLCWISMSPLYYLNPIGKWLFYMGKLKIYENLKKLGYINE